MHIVVAEHTAEVDIVAEQDGIATEVAAVEVGEHGNLDTVEEVADKCRFGHGDAVDGLIDEAFEVDAANLNAPRWVLSSLSHKVESVAVEDTMLRSQRRLKGT